MYERATVSNAVKNYLKIESQLLQIFIILEILAKQIRPISARLHDIEVMNTAQQHTRKHRWTNKNKDFTRFLYKYT